ncbi:hypothetical protein Pmani_026531 [Petrolisthes manimaculis]|uniref:Uncharacterized protein n=1 Tax=Petrolisthes manimaculis TaxID=1843537 RepID=A0AAE1TXS1_9EUCA|nr:hypothetical protein Pmani_026531 [Petrolisthes manimaculis]
MSGVKRQRLSSRVGGEGKGLYKHHHATTPVTLEERTNQGREEYERCELWTPHSLAPSPPATHILRSGLTSGCGEDGQPPPCQASGVYGRGAGQRPLMSAAANDSWETRAGRGAAGNPGLGLGCRQGATGHHNNTTNTLQHWRQELEQGAREMKNATVTIVCCLMKKHDSQGRKLKPWPRRGSGRVGGGEAACRLIKAMFMVDQVKDLRRDDVNTSTSIVSQEDEEEEKEGEEEYCVGGK